MTILLPIGATMLLFAIAQVATPKASKDDWLMTQEIENTIKSALNMVAAISSLFVWMLWWVW